MHACKYLEHDIFYRGKKKTLQSLGRQIVIKFSFIISHQYFSSLPAISQMMLLLATLTWQKYYFIIHTHHKCII
jgi:hypothetical protein